MEKISKAIGIPIETLNQEVDNRTRLLEKMKRESIMSYKEVTDIVRRYYMDSEAVLNEQQLSHPADIPELRKGQENITVTLEDAAAISMEAEEKKK